MQHKTLILGLTALGDDLSDPLLSYLEPLGDFFFPCFEKYERENFGVQQYPLEVSWLNLSNK